VQTGEPWPPTGSWEPIVNASNGRPVSIGTDIRLDFCKGPNSSFPQPGSSFFGSDSIVQEGDKLWAYKGGGADFSVSELIADRLMRNSKRHRGSAHFIVPSAP